MTTDMEQIRSLIVRGVQELYGQEVDVILSRPDEQFGDYATNVALQLAGRLGKNPREVAEAIAGALQHESIEKAEVAGPGFINIWLKAKAIELQVHDSFMGLSSDNARLRANGPLADKKYVV